MDRTIKILGSKKYLMIAMVMLFLLLVGSDLWAQCPMCRTAAESNLKDGWRKWKRIKRRNTVHALRALYHCDGVRIDLVSELQEKKCSGSIKCTKSEHTEFLLWASNN